MAVCWRSVTLYVILLHRPSAPVTPVWGIQKVIRMPVEGFFRREAVGALSFDFSTEKFMFKRTWQVVFWGTRNDSGVPKQLAARLKARDGLHSKVVTPESGKRGTKNGKTDVVIYRSALKKWLLLKKRINFIRIINLLQAVFFHLTVQYSGFIFSNRTACSRCPLHIWRSLIVDAFSVFLSFNDNIKGGTTSFVYSVLSVFRSESSNKRFSVESTPLFCQ